MVAQKFSLGLFSFQTILHLLPICTTVFFSDGCLLGWLGKLVLPVRVDLLENGLGADRIGGGNWLELIVFETLGMLEWKLDVVKGGQQICSFVYQFLLVLFLVDGLDGSVASVHAI